MSNKQCPSCGVLPGQLHGEYCDVARCKNCGYQLFGDGVMYKSCGKAENTTWKGEWPGKEECREFGWYTSPDSHWGVMEDLNRLFSTDEVEWDRTLERFVPRIV